MNNVAIIKRLSEILEHYEMSAAIFADKINVQRSSLSHLLNGRNKPSLDFILKIDAAFSEVDLHWLLYGKGVFPSNLSEDGHQTTVIENQKNNAKNLLSPTTNKPIERMVIFYKDGTFQSFKEL